MSNIKRFAENELDILVKSNTDLENRPIIEPFIPEILALVEKFAQSGQSGASAPFVARALSSSIEKLCLQEPIMPITGVDEEWNDVTEHNNGELMWQNKRCSSLFKYENGDVSFCDAIIKKTERGSCWSGAFWLSKKDYLTGDKSLMIRGSQLIRGFPFVPKTFVIDVIEDEVAPDDWEMYLKDSNQLKEVFEYYKPLPITRKVLVEKNN